MKTNDLILRCYAEREADGAWFAMCIDLNLYARAGSLDAVRARLHGFIKDYVTEAATEDQAHFLYLIRRRAPAGFVIKYYLTAVFGLCRTVANGCKRQLFEDHLPVVPA